MTTVDYPDCLHQLLQSEILGEAVSLELLSSATRCPPPTFSV